MSGVAEIRRVLDIALAKFERQMQRPNILWIVTTQWRAQACGYAGDPNARTPHLDRLAAEAVDYAQAVTPHPFGPFARAAMLTGVPSPQNGVKDYFDPLPADAKTVAHRLREQGYATAFFGKWHLGRRDPRAPLVGEAHARSVVPPVERGGFEFWEGFESGFLLNDPWLHGTRLPEPVRFEGYQSDVLCARAREWLIAECGLRNADWPAGDSRSTGARSPDRSVRPEGDASASLSGRPVFCVLSLEAPHPPYDAPSAGVQARDPREIVLPANVPRGGEVEAKARRELAGYYAHLQATDAAIGRLLESGGLEDTIVVFTSVHGDMHGAHGLFRKGWPQEESVRVPLLVHDPRSKDGGQRTEGGGRRTEDGRRILDGGGRMTPTGRRSDEAVSLVDLSAITLAWASGVLPPASGAHAFISMPSVVPFPHQCDRVWRGVRTPQRKLVLNADGSPWRFFDLEKDPGEQNDLSGNPAFRGEIAALTELVRKQTF
jgi:arylsulfatase A-like enzyme